MEQLPDMTQVRQLTLAVLNGKDTLWQAFAHRDRLKQRGDPFDTQHMRPVVESAMDGLPGELVRARDLGPGPPDEDAERGGTCSRCGGGSLQRLQESQPVERRAVGEDASRAVDDGRDTDEAEGVSHERGIAVASYKDGEIPRPDGASALLRPVGCPRGDLRT